LNALLALLIAKADAANQEASQALDLYEEGYLTHTEATAIVNVGALPQEALRAYQADHSWWDDDGVYHPY
jgi:hypothetical protein